MMSSPKAVQELGREHDRKPVGTGPWKLVSFADGEKVVTTRNDKYWKPGLPLLDGIEMAIIPEVATGLRSVMAGENHYVYSAAGAAAAARRAQQEPHRRERSDRLLHPALLQLRAPAVQRRPRPQAVNHTINREDFVKLTMGGAGGARSDAAADHALGLRQGDRKALSARHRQGEGAARRGRLQGRPRRQHGRLHRSE